MLHAAMFTLCIGVAGAAPLGQIVRVRRPGERSGPDSGGPGRQPLVQRPDRRSRPDHDDRGDHRVHERPEPGQRRPLDRDGPGREHVVQRPRDDAGGRDDQPVARRRSASSARGLNAGSMPLGIAAGPDGNVWFTDNGTTKAIGVINPTTHAISEFSSGLNPGSSPQQGLVAGPDGNLWFTDSGTTKAIGMINPTTHAIIEFSERPQSRQPPERVDRRRPGRRPLVHGQRHDAGDRADRPDDARDQRVQQRPEPGRQPGPGRGRPGRQHLVRRQGSDAVDRDDQPDHARDHAVQRRLERGQPAGRDRGRARTATSGSPTRARSRAIGRVGVGAPAASVSASVRDRSGGVGVPKACGGDVWSTWAGQQPSHSAFGFDGYQWLLDGSPIAGRPAPRTRRRGRRGPSALVSGHGHLSAPPGHRLRDEHGGARRRVPRHSWRSRRRRRGSRPRQEPRRQSRRDRGLPRRKRHGARVRHAERVHQRGERQTGKKIRPAFAASLITQARATIEAALGC